MFIQKLGNSSLNAVKSYRTFASGISTMVHPSNVAPVGGPFCIGKILRTENGGTYGYTSGQVGKNVETNKLVSD